MKYLYDIELKVREESDSTTLHESVAGGTVRAESMKDAVRDIKGSLYQRVPVELGMLLSKGSYIPNKQDALIPLSPDDVPPLDIGE